MMVAGMMRRVAKVIYDAATPTARAPSKRRPSDVELDDASLERVAGDAEDLCGADDCAGEASGLADHLSSQRAAKDPTAVL